MFTIRHEKVPSLPVKRTSCVFYELYQPAAAAGGRIWSHNLSCTGQTRTYNQPRSSRAAIASYFINSVQIVQIGLFANCANVQLFAQLEQNL
jgi:hypothetical protein